MLVHISVMRIQSAVCWYSDEDAVSSTLLLSVQNFEFSEFLPLMEKWYCIWSNHTLNKIIYVITEFSNTFWDMRSCSLLCRWHCFVATCYPYIQGCLVTPSISQSSNLAWRWGQQCSLLKHWYLCRSLHGVSVIPISYSCNKQQHETLYSQKVCLWKKKLCIKWNSCVKNWCT